MGPFRLKLRDLQGFYSSGHSSGEFNPFPVSILRGNLPFLTHGISSIFKSTSWSLEVFLRFQFFVLPLPYLEDCCDYTSPVWVIRDNQDQGLAALFHLLAAFSLLGKNNISKVLWIRMWTSLGSPCSVYYKDFLKYKLLYVTQESLYIRLEQRIYRHL